MKYTLPKLLVGALVLFAICAPTMAGTTTSEKKIVKQILSNGGTQGQSATFTEVGTFGETIVGVREGSTFTVSQGFWNAGSSAASCCVGLVGNVDCDPNDQVDIVDLTVLIDYLFVTFTPLCCEAEGNFGPELTGVPAGVAYRPDIASITAMIDYLFVSFNTLPACP